MSTTLVAVTQHDRKGDHAHGDHRCPDHAGRGREQGTNEYHRHGQAATDRSEELADGLQQVFRELGFLQHGAHEDEVGDGEQDAVAHDSENAVGHRVEEVEVEEVHPNSDGRKDDGRTSECEGHGIAAENKDQDCAEHDRRHHLRVHTKRTLRFLPGAYPE
jgi:hypothetical protein